MTDCGRWQAGGGARKEALSIRERHEAVDVLMASLNWAKAQSAGLGL